MILPCKVDNYQWLNRLDTQFNEPTNKSFKKVPKVVNETIKKTLFKDFGDYCNKQQNVPFLPELLHNIFIRADSELTLLSYVRQSVTVRSFR